MDCHQGHHEPQCAGYHGRLGEGARRYLLMCYSPGLIRPGFFRYLRVGVKLVTLLPELVPFPAGSSGKIFPRRLSIASRAEAIRSRLLAARAQCWPWSGATFRASVLAPSTGGFTGC